MKKSLFSAYVFAIIKVIIIRENNLILIKNSGGSFMDEERVRYFIQAEKNKGTSTEELIFILSDNGIPIYEISNYLDLSVKYVEDILSDY